MGDWDVLHHEHLVMHMCFNMLAFFVCRCCSGLQSGRFTEGREVIGVVIDVFGLVTQPHYLVYPTCARRENLGVDAMVFAAVALPETSFICDSSDLQAVRAALMQDTETGLPDADGDAKHASG